MRREYYFYLYPLYRDLHGHAISLCFKPGYNHLY